MARILVTGGNGQLGNELKSLWGEKPEIFYTDVSELNITEKDAVERFVYDNKIDVIVNCAAYTAVDKAEEDEATATLVNATAPGILADAAKAAGAGRGKGALLVHVSTDYVFDGKGCRPYTESDTPAPAGAYGRTKLLGEQAVTNSGCSSIIIRTSWLYSSYGANFVKTIARLSAERESLNVVFDQIGTPTHAGDLAVAIDAAVTKWLITDTEERKALEGIYHFSNEGVCSWYDFAKEIVQLRGTKCKVNPVTSDLFPTKAVRPAFSVLDKSKIKRNFGIEIRHWREPLSEIDFTTL